MTESTHVQHCAGCGQRIRKLNPHRMDKQKVAMLELLAKARLAGAEWSKVDHGSGFEIKGQMVEAPYRAEAHASRLRWFGLAEHGEHRSGLYRITDEGLRFLLGACSVPAVIYCKDGVVVERSAERVNINEVRGVALDKAYWDEYAALQKPEYTGLLF